MKFSKYDWLESHISEENVDTIMKQLENGNIYTLTEKEFYTLAKPGDLHLYLGYYRDPENNLHYHKVTNDTRRNIIKAIKIKNIIDQDTEKCLNCGSIDCYTCMQVNRDKYSRPGYIVVCHSCNYTTTYR